MKKTGKNMSKNDISVFRKEGFFGVFLNIFSSVFHLRKKIWFYSSAFDILNLYTGLYFPSI